MTEQPSWCPYCGKPAVPGAAFCAYCGERFPAGQEDLRPAGEVARSIPLPDRDQIEGRCAVIHTGREDMDIRTVGGIVAEFSGKPKPDVTRMMRTTKGFIASAMESGEAVALAKRLEEDMGLSVIVVSERDCVPLPEAMRMRQVAIHDSGLQCEAYTWDRTARLEVAWNEVFLVSCGRVEVERVTEGAPEPKPRGNPFMRSVPELITERFNEFLIDIVLHKPWRRLRLDYNTAAYAFRDEEPDRQESLESLKNCAMRLIEHAVGVPMSHGVRLLVSADPGSSVWEELSFLNKRDFDSYTCWLLQLVRFGEGLPD